MGRSYICGGQPIVCVIIELLDSGGGQLCVCVCVIEVHDCRSYPFVSLSHTHTYRKRITELILSFLHWSLMRSMQW